ncbi:MAG: GntR family transcriptional regulator [Dictyoglomaceae bacterium]|nr:GntR family transcriptional regulator [Dictyoglomaceae bacterium]
MRRKGLNKEEIYKNLKEKILKENLAPGEWIVEREICEEYGISRTIAREILRMLIFDGLVELQPNKGYIVRKLTLEEIVDIFQAREAIEGISAYLACLKGDEEFFNYIRELREKLEEIDIDKDVSEGVAIGRKLHDAIIKATKNSILIEFYEKLKNLAALTSNITKRSVNIENKSKEYHIEIMKALEDRNPDKSEYLMREHLRITLEGVLREFYNSLKY